MLAFLDLSLLLSVKLPLSRELHNRTQGDDVGRGSRMLHVSREIGVEGLDILPNHTTKPRTVSKAIRHDRDLSTSIAPIV